MPANPIPQISIVTIVRNGKDVIEKTMLSVLNQTCSPIEYIVVDGASTDGTLDIITNYELRITNGEFPNITFRYISEPDKGIYDAMNKGIALAKGDYVNFMNAGDIFADNYVIQKVIDLSNQEIDVIYGDNIAIDESNQMSIFVPVKPLSQIWKGMVFSHQAVFIKREKLQKFPFNLQYKLVAEYNQLLKLYKNGCSFKYLPITIAKTTIGGLSSSNKAAREVIKMMYSEYTMKNVMPFVYPLIFDFMRKLLGKRIISKIRRWKWKKQNKNIQNNSNHN